MAPWPVAAVHPSLSLPSCPEQWEEQTLGVESGEFDLVPVSSLTMAQDRYYSLSEPQLHLPWQRH